MRFPASRYRTRRAHWLFREARAFVCGNASAIWGRLHKAREGLRAEETARTRSVGRAIFVDVPRREGTETLICYYMKSRETFASIADACLSWTYTVETLLEGEVT